MVYLFWVFGEMRILYWVYGIFSIGLIFVNVGFVGKMCNFFESKNAITTLISFIFIFKFFMLICVLVDVKIHLMGCFLLLWIGLM